MLFHPQRYKIEDRKGEPFIDAEEIRSILGRHVSPSAADVARVIEKSLARRRLSLEETAILLNAPAGHCEQMIFEAAARLKKEVYGDRIVIFAPLYIGNRCMNNCSYCGFRAGNAEAVRRTLTPEEIVAEVEQLGRQGQKRLILVWGEHDIYDARHIAETVKLVYGTTRDNDRINRVNINAAPQDTDGFRIIKEAGIGTYQIFQETYDRETYARFHPSGRKRDYNYRLTALDRAMEAGIDDVGLGVLFGLGDWCFEVMALVRHTNHLEAVFGVGPHTISFPRIRNASNIDTSQLSDVDDRDFMKIIAVLRLAVPYAGLILTAREPDTLRDRLIDYGVSQIDAGTNLEIGGYSAPRTSQDLAREQFRLSDERTLEETVGSLVGRGCVPSFCTACYRKGRTGEHFMEFSTRGFIKRFCTPNSLLTFAEYLEDYASEQLRERGYRLIDQQLAGLDSEEMRRSLAAMLSRIRSGERDLLL